MAKIEKIKGNIIYSLRHNTRETPKPYGNTDIDETSSHLNYQLSPITHGTTAEECKKYYTKRLDEVQHIDSDRLITACECIVSAPADLAPAQATAFFEEVYHYLLSSCGGEEACISAIVHRDEKVKDIEGNPIAGADHLHFIFIPEVENPKHTSLKSKFAAGLKTVQKKYGKGFLSKDKVQSLYARIKKYETDASRSRETNAIRDIGDILGVKRDDARSIFRKIRRLDSELYKKKVCANDLVSKKFLSEFHPKMQKHLDEAGIQCTVYSEKKTGNEINLTVSQLKEITKATGIVLDKALTVDELANLINENITLKSKLRDLEKDCAPEWGQASRWGQEKNRGDMEWST